MIYLERQDISFGILLILIGVLFLLFNFNLISFSVAIFVLSIGILIRYFMNNNSLNLILGLILLGISSVLILDQYVFTSLEMKEVLFIWIFALIGFLFFIKEKNRLFLLLSLSLFSIGIYLVVYKLSQSNPIWFLLILLAIVFYIYYLLGYKTAGIEWPKKISFILLFLALIIFVFVKLNNTNIAFLKLINYIWPIILILFGIKLIYNKNKY